MNEQKKSTWEQLQELKAEMALLSANLTYLAFLKRVGVKCPVIGNTGIKAGEGN